MKLLIQPTEANTNGDLKHKWSKTSTNHRPRVCPLQSKMVHKASRTSGFVHMEYPYCWWFRNPAPFDMANMPLFTRFHTSQVVFSLDFWTNNVVSVMLAVSYILTTQTQLPHHAQKQSKGCATDLGAKPDLWWIDRSTKRLRIRTWQEDDIERCSRKAWSQSLGDETCKMRLYQKAQLPFDFNKIKNGNSRIARLQYF